MTRRVAIVTDSTASVPPDVAERLGITIVQLDLTVGEESNDERRIPHGRLANALREGVSVSTAPPPPPAFFWNYTDAVEAGAEAIVSIHLSAELSGTCESARTAAAEIGVPVYVVDSQLCGLGFGYPVIAAARAADAGADVRTVLDILDKRLRATTELLYVDTLEYLRRGGRVGASQAAFAKALSIKPILVMRDGKLEPMAKGIGAQRALEKAIDKAVRYSGQGRVEIAAEHFEAEQRARWVIDRLGGRLPDHDDPILAETSAIIGAHTGPGAVGITISPI